MSGFRAVPWLSPATPVSAVVKLGGALGLGGHVMELVTTKLLMPQRQPRQLRGYEPTEHDVFIAVYPKSGTNWAMQISTQLAFHGRAEFGHIHDLVPWPEAPFPNIVPLSDRSVIERSPTGLRAIKTHLFAPFVPFSPRARYITVIRDPKEVLVSAYHFVTGIFGLRHRISPQEWFQRSIERPQVNRLWAEHTAGYWARREQPNVLVMTYAEMKADLHATVTRFADFLGVTMPEEDFEEVVRRSSFAHMREHEEQFGPPRLPLVRADEMPLMMRRGVSGGSDEMLSAEQGAAIDRLSRETLRELGSDLPYDELFGASAA